MDSFELLTMLKVADNRATIVNIMNVAKSIYQDKPDFKALFARNDMAMLATMAGIIAAAEYPDADHCIEQMNKMNECINNFETLLDGSDGLFFTINKEQINQLALMAALFFATQITNNQ